MTKESNNFVGVLAIVLSLMLFTTVLLGQQRLEAVNSSFEERRVLCNQTVLADRKLAERENYISVLWGNGDTEIKTVSEAKREIDGLNHRFLITNKEVNDMRALLSCYFDK